ncbi:hypothetical protein GCM10007108_13280 [Thermogymnomonas acidicola]|uniref:Uncharacterized protein n=1 Tax=Thermogymnomonas acidicola TaxID=399579 RepID=A0AA37BSX8_9ARCH|nr:hypothetical protein [Thermogymnomonas acidicola]GGM76560.1 hypothetical protein GCM10007108_13280 [Thermogymnomonas acidicola]
MITRILSYSDHLVVGDIAKAVAIRDASRLDGHEFVKNNMMLEIVHSIYDYICDTTLFKAISNLFYQYTSILFYQYTSILTEMIADRYIVSIPYGFFGFKFVVDAIVKC